MSLNEVEQLLYRYTRGECTPQECAIIEKWLEENNFNINQWQSLNERSQKVWLNNLFDEILQDISQPPVSAYKAVKTTKFSAWYSVAAAVVFLFVAIAIWQYRPFSSTAVVQQLLVETEPGHRKQFTLSDGTRVWLQGGSSLHYPKQFEDKERLVTLSGEAYFEVKTDPKYPFKVATQNLITKVLGTSFNISAYPESDENGVILENGAVNVYVVGREEEGIILAPLQAAWYQKKTGKLTKGAVEKEVTSQHLQEGNLIFNQTPLHEVLYRISKAYGVHFNYDENATVNCRLTGSFSSSQSIDELLKTISISLSSSYQRSGKEVAFKSKGC